MKLSSFKRSSVVKASAAEREQGKMEKAPLGRLVSVRISPIKSAPNGVKLAGLSTNGQPTASAAATLWATRFKGKLKGEMKEQGPIATRFQNPVYPRARGLMSNGITSP